MEDALKTWLTIAALAISCGTFVYTWLTGRAKQAHERIDKEQLDRKTSEAMLLSRIANLELRVAAIEADVEHLPDKDVAHRMEMAIVRLEGRLESMDERLKPVAAMASRMQDYIMEKADR
jgi:uncharacterized coiled-coil protein SlyX